MNLYQYIYQSIFKMQRPLLFTNLNKLKSWTSLPLLKSPKSIFDCENHFFFFLFSIFILAHIQDFYHRAVNFTCLKIVRVSYKLIISSSSMPLGGESLTQTARINKAEFSASTHSEVRENTANLS